MMNTFFHKKTLFQRKMTESYFTIRNNKSTTLYISLSPTSLGHDTKISINNDYWVDISSNPKFELSGNSSVRISRIRDDQNINSIFIMCYIDSNYTVQATDINTYNITVYGNIMSLLYGDDFFTNMETMNYKINRLFANNKILTDASKLVLPAINLVDNAYSGMFSGCSNLKYPPKVLPATLGPKFCYEIMFQYCTSLICTPIILLTDQTDYTESYGGQCASMFSGCTSLTSIDIYFAIPGVGMGASRPGAATDDMFSDCTSLTEVNLRAPLLQQNCYAALFGSTILTQSIFVNIYARSFDVDNLSSQEIITRYFLSFPNSSNYTIRTYNTDNTEAQIAGEKINEAFSVYRSNVNREFLIYDASDLSDNTPPEVDIEL